MESDIFALLRGAEGAEPLRVLELGVSGALHACPAQVWDLTKQEAAPA